MGSIPWLAEALTASRKSYLDNASSKAAAKSKGKTGLKPVHPDSDERRRKLADATANAAKKLREEAAQKSSLAAQREAERQATLVREAAVEYLRVTFGKKQAPTPAPLQEKLKKACKCHLTKAQGMHKDTCSLHPFRLQATLRFHEQDRANVGEQLRTRTSLTPMQRESALTHLFGPSLSSAARSAQGRNRQQDPATKIPQFDPLLTDVVKRGVVRGLCGGCAGIWSTGAI